MRGLVQCRRANCSFTFVAPPGIQPNLGDETGFAKRRSTRALYAS
jgi:hypothetical protein